MRLKSRNGDVYDVHLPDEPLLKLLYETLPGRLVLKLVTRPGLSRFVGRLLSTRASACLIGPFVRKFNMDLSEYEPTAYDSYNAFFSRKIRPETRPVDMDPSHFISPCDGKLTVLPVTADGTVTVKHTRYTVASLLKNEALAKEYEGGSMLIFRLAVDDYHRYCYVASGKKGENIRILGVLHTVQPVAYDYVSVYKENCREYSVLSSDVFGDILMMEVGALMVGKIVNFHGAQTVCRGQEKGCFQFGGSTVVLMVKAGMLQVDPDILENSAELVETIVKYGERIGCKL